MQIASLFATTRTIVDSPQTGPTSARGARVFMSGGAYRTATKDLVYAVWPDLSGEAGCTTGAGPGVQRGVDLQNSNLVFTRSTDGGGNLGLAPQMLNNQTSLNDQSFSRLVVDETDGTLMVVYYDTVNDPTRLSTNIFAQYSNG